jgi:predicted transposase/invertase (TIGR01784 family)
MVKDNLIRFDWAMKRLLRNKANYTVLECFLSVLLHEDISIVSISESESNKEDAKDKFNRVDILVENSSGELVIIELQNSYEVDYFLRMLYGVSKAITEYIGEGDRYGEVRKVYHINIVYFKIGEGKDYVYHGTTEFRGIHYDDLLHLTAEQKTFFAKENIKDLYPEYYILNVRDFDDVAKDSLDEWIYYFKNNAIPDNFTARGLAEARENLLYTSLSEAEKKNYDHHLKQTRYEQNAIEDSFEIGKAEGKTEGLAEGIAKEKEEIALKMLKKGMSIEDITDITGLTQQQIEGILKQEDK